MTISIIYVPKISKNITIIVKLKHFVSKQHTLNGVYYSLIYPYLTYAFYSLGKQLSIKFHSNCKITKQSSSCHK